MKVFIVFLLVISALLLEQCAGKTVKFDSKMNQLSLGMTPDQVKTTLGEPDLREASKEGELWHYTEKVEQWHENQDEGRYARFKDGKLSSFGKESGEARKNGLAVPAPGPAPSVVGGPQPSPVFSAPLPIGGECHHDVDCQSGNCHFNTCAGANNCRVLVGRVCATNADCCSGYCNFGVCGKKTHSK